MINLDSLCLRYTSSEYKILDQTLLPHQEVWTPIKNVNDMVYAIQTLQVRWAPGLYLIAGFASTGIKFMEGELIPLDKKANLSVL